VKKIIHPTDYSKNATAAFEFAIDLSKKLNAELILLHVSEFPEAVDSFVSKMTYEEMEAEKKNADLERLQNFASDYLTDIYSTSNILFEVIINSSPSKGILEAVNDYNADFVVMGTKGESKLREVIMGSTTKKLIEDSPCPVISIPEHSGFTEIKNIIYSSDFDENDIAVLKKLSDFAMNFNADITVVHIFHEDSIFTDAATGYQKQLAEQVHYPGLQYHYETSDDIVGSLLDYLKNNDADLVVMYEKETNGMIQRLLHHDMVKLFAMDTTIPLMSFNSFSIETKTELRMAVSN
jgi:nucleotide-binding universal stress UspA family protein